MNFKSYLLRFFSLLVFAMIVSCDKDFNEIGTDIVGGDNDHYQFDKYENTSIKSYNQKLGPVAMHNLPINPLGIYKNPVYGTTNAGFVSQIEMASGSIGRTFNNTDSSLYQDLPVIDSVILNIPYYSRLLETDSDGVKTYQLDSIYGQIGSKFRLSVYQSNYYLRDLDPSSQFTEQQVFYNDMQEIENQKTPFVLNNLPITHVKNLDGHENEQFYFDKREHKTTVIGTDGEEDDTRFAPSMRLHLDEATFYNKIINAPSGQLVNNSVFKNYFRGLYFKVEDLGNSNSMAMINFANAKVTIYYREDSKITNATTNEVTFEKVSKTFEMNFAGNRVSLQSNSNENVNYITAANSSQEASRLYLKGGQGSIAIIDLFSSQDLYGYDVLKVGGVPVDENGNAVPLDSNGKPISGHYLIYTKTNTPNGVSDELDDFRFPLINNEIGQIYHSIKNRWLINEANLTFTIDQTAMPASQPLAVEPNRIMLYDLNNNTVLIDYTIDQRQSGIYPKQNKYVHGGILLDQDGAFVKQIKNTTTGEIENRGTKYKIRLTNHLKNLITKDSTNVRLGLSVTESINTIGFVKLKTPIGDIKKVPQMSALSPLGTILYGTNLPLDDDKRLKLEIYYTKPD
jgi:hypothetical protein